MQFQEIISVKTYLSFTAQFESLNSIKNQSSNLTEKLKLKSKLKISRIHPLLI